MSPEVWMRLPLREQCAAWRAFSGDAMAAGWLDPSQELIRDFAAWLTDYEPPAPTEYEIDAIARIQGGVRASLRERRA